MLTQVMVDDPRWHSGHTVVPVFADTELHAGRCRSPQEADVPSYETFIRHLHIHPHAAGASSSYMHDREIKLKGQFH